MRGSPVYYGWFVLAASAVSEMLLQGATSYSAGLFVLPLQAEFHISRADANSSILFMFLGVVLVAPFAGRILDAWAIRRVMSVGAVILGLSLVGIALSPALWMMAAILLLPMPVAFMILGPLNTSTMAARWFHRHRGLAMGIAAVATSGGGFTVVPLLSAAIRHYGWRPALLYEGVAIALIIIALTFVLRDRPSDIGLDNHSENRDRETAAKLSDAVAVDWKSIFTSRAFLIPALTLTAISGTCQAIVITLVPYGVQLGASPTTAALLVSAFAIAAAVTKVVAGSLADYISQYLLLIGAAGLMTLSWLILSLSVAYGALFASSCLAGMALGCALPTTSSLVAVRFGSARFGRVMSWVYPLTFGLAILAVRFVGFMYDRFGGYHAAFECFAVLLAGLLILTLLFSPQRQAA